MNNKEILFSGVAKPNLLVDTMIITLSSVNKSPLIIVQETIDYATKIFDNIQNQIKKLANL